MDGRDTLLKERLDTDAEPESRPDDGTDSDGGDAR